MKRASVYALLYLLFAACGEPDVNVDETGYLTGDGVSYPPRRRDPPSNDREHNGMDGAATHRDILLRFSASMEPDSLCCVA